MELSLQQTTKRLKSRMALPLRSQMGDRKMLVEKAGSCYGDTVMEAGAFS